jgi:signal transduction histidine kinase
VRVEVSFKEAWVCVSVRDQGVGIPPEAMPRLFDRFFHLDTVGGRMFGGVGLGLSIARQVVEQHGGLIEAESELGKGSRFFVQFKAQTS